MKRVIEAVVIVLVLIGLLGFVHVPFSNAADKADEAKKDEGGIIGKIPPKSPFSKIKIGMTMNEVYALIGEPTDTKHYPTGKSFIPFYHGDDEFRSEALYKGQGRITFTGSRHKVWRIAYDPSEKGQD